jgi:hypothetical protein
MKTTISDTDKLILIADVMNKAFDETESWREDHLGCSLAYLAHAIATDENVDWSDENGDEFTERLRELFRAWFKPNHDVWKFIIT